MMNTAPLIETPVLALNSESILNCVSDSILIHNFYICDDVVQTRQFFFANNAALTLTGYSREELLLCDPLSLFRTGSQEWYPQLLKNALDGFSEPHRTTIVNKTFCEIHVEILVCVHENENCYDSTCIIRQINENDNSHKENRTSSDTPFLSAENMPSLNTLVSGIAHEINNPNNLISLSTDLLRDIWDEVWTLIESQITDASTLMHGHKLQKNAMNLLNNILTGSDRINQTISTIREFIRIYLNEKKTDCDLPSIMNSAVLTTDILLKKSTNIFNLIIESDIPKIKGFQQLIQQSFVNIINNACEALTDPSQKITISMSFSAETKSIITSIIDEGEGIPPNNTALISDPFFTTRRSKGHLGLGLSVAYSAVHKHNGKIEIDSQHGFGTTVVIKLPVN